MVDTQDPMQSLDAVLERSFIIPSPEVLPQEGDQWVLLHAHGQSSESVRYILYTRCRPITYTGNETKLELTEYEMESRETLNTTYQLEGFGEIVIYSQDDPSWDRLIFESDYSSRRRPFGDGGCGPTAIALALANLLPAEELCKINAFSPDSYGYTICTCSITQTHCRRRHVPYRLDEPEELVKYLPLVIANFATGNNTLDVQGRYDRFGSSMDYLSTLCSEVFGLSVTEISDKDLALQILENKQGMIITCTAHGTPFTRTSHYITLAGADDTYLYILDPLRRESYEELDHYGMLEVITPGLVRMAKHNIHNLSMNPLYLIPNPSAQ